LLDQKLVDPGSTLVHTAPLEVWQV